MANELQWRPVDAPQLDTRGLALAGQTINNSFSKFNDILTARDAKLNKDATNAVGVQIAAAQTPAQLAAIQAKIAAGGVDPRADALTLANGVNARQGAILQNSARQQQMDIGKETLLDKQAMTQLGDAGLHFNDLMGQGKHDEALAFAHQQASNNPLWGRVAYQFGQDGAKSFADNRDAAQRARVNDANIKDSAGRLQLARNADSRAAGDMAATDSAFTLAKTMAGEPKYAGLDPKDAVALAAADPRVTALGATGMKVFDSSFGPMQTNRSTPTSDIVRSTAPQQALLTAADANIAAKQRAAAMAADTPLAAAALASATKDPKNPRNRNTVLTNYDALSPNWTNYGSKTEVDRILANAKLSNGQPVTLGDLDGGVANLVTSQNNLWDKLPDASTLATGAMAAIPGGEALGMLLDSKKSDSFPNLAWNAAIDTGNARIKAGGLTPVQQGALVTAKDEADVARAKDLLLKQQRLVRSGQSLPKKDEAWMNNTLARLADPHYQAGQEKAPIVGKKLSSQEMAERQKLQDKQINHINGAGKMTLAEVKRLAELNGSTEYSR
jgi:hypothetical protein